MRDYEGWNREDFKRYQQWMLRVFSDQSFGFLQERHGCADDHYWSNWGLCNVLCEISVGILCDDIYVYNAGMEYYKYMEDHRTSVDPSVISDKCRNPTETKDMLPWLWFWQRMCVGQV